MKSYKSQYIKKTPRKGLIYEDKGNTQIVRYFNVDWAGSWNNRCFTLEYCVLVGGNLISRKSKKQNVRDNRIHDNDISHLWAHMPKTAPQRA